MTDFHHVYSIDIDPSFHHTVVLPTPEFSDPHHHHLHLSFDPLALLKRRQSLRLIIWILGFLFLIGLTVQDFVPVLEDYTTNNVATNVKVVIVDPAFRPPQLVVCLPYHKLENKNDEGLMEIARHLINGSLSMKKCDLCAKMRTHDWDVWNRMNVSEYAQRGRLPLYNALSLKIARKLLESPDVDYLDPKYAAWNSALFSSALNFFIWQGENDYYFRQYNLDGVNFTLALDDYNRTDRMDLLFDRLLSALCRRMHFVESEYADEFQAGVETNRTCDDVFVNDSSAPVYLDVKGLWLRLPATDRPKIQEYIFTFPREFSNETDLLWTATNESDQQSLLIYPDTSSYYSTDMDPFYATTIYETPTKLRSAGHFITARYSVQMRAIEKRAGHSAECHNESSATVCFTKCTKRWIERNCGCVAFSEKRGLDYNRSLPYCSQVDYERCRPKEYPDRDKEYCLEKCRTACEYTSYDWQITHQFYDDLATSTNSNLNRGVSTKKYRFWIVPSFNAFAEFTWKIKNTPEQFLSQTGGLLNFYLGVSGMSFFAFVITCMEFFLKRKQKREDEKSGGTEESGRSSKDGDLDQKRWSKFKRNLESEMEKRLDEKMRIFKDDLKYELMIGVRNSTRKKSWWFS